MAGFTGTQIAVAGAWQTVGHLWCTHPGSWDAAAQLRAVAQALFTHRDSGLRRPRRGPSPSIPGSVLVASAGQWSCEVRPRVRDRVWRHPFSLLGGGLVGVD
jgi:hypothetical protein